MIEMNDRINSLRNKMKDLSLPAVLITDPANVLYYSGFTGSPGDGILFITFEDARILTDSRYTLQVSSQCPDYIIHGSSSADISSLKDLITRLNLSKIGFENNSISYALWHRITLQFPNLSLIPLNDLLMQFRNFKDETELFYIQKSCQIAVQSLRETVQYIKPGVSEREIALELEYRMRKNGASGPSFDTIVASGMRSALPHGVASGRILKEGEPVTVDFGAIYEGYCSDMTRTFFVGEPSAQLKNIYMAVFNAQKAALENFFVGISSFELDRIARNVLEESGYGKFFTHALGHGVGIEIHEGITIGRKKSTPIEPGMVFSIEPGVYIEGVGGVRIEDLVYCSNDGIVNLTADFEKELAIL